MDKKELKEKYKMDFKIIRKSVNGFDPCGLIFPLRQFISLTRNRP